MGEWVRDWSCFDGWTETRMEWKLVRALIWNSPVLVSGWCSCNCKLGANLYYSILNAKRTRTGFGNRPLSKNTTTLFVCLPKFYISIVFIFSWHHSKYPEKMETMFMQNFGGKTKSVMAFLKVAYWTLNLAISTENLDNVMTKFIIDKSTDP